jgi:trehalose 6-phosphate phosphatase
MRFSDPATDTILGPPPLDLLSDAALFLDFDGTLTELVDRPDAVVVDADLADLLVALVAARPGRVAIVSGRSVAQLDAMLGGAGEGLALAGSHGAELRAPGGKLVTVAAPAALDDVIAATIRFAAAHPGAMAEIKTLGAALHYRRAPEHADAALDRARTLAAEHGLFLQHGKMMVEVRVDGDKGRAVTRLAADPAMHGARPLVFGDDVTDEAGFAAAAGMGGAGVLVGSPRDTAATHALPDVAAVRRWLRSAMAARA